MTGRIRVAVLYGGQSGEHEVSLHSAASVIRHLDRDRFEIVPVGIDRQGRWWSSDLEGLEAASGEALAIPDDATEVRLSLDAAGGAALLPVGGPALSGQAVDVVCPVVHGPLCEDGAIQGHLELLGVAYVGSGILASAAGMDKDVAKRLAAAAGLPVAPYLALTRRDHVRDPEGFARTARERLTLPVFVKPCNMGSSVGIHKVQAWETLGAALEDAFLYDLKVLVEQGIDAREIEVAVLEEDPLLVSVASEINAGPQHDFYSYAAKYLDADGATVDLPAKLDPAQMETVQGLAAKAFAVLEASGLARGDFFLARPPGAVCFNEINTLPGFTALSMYPKMMEASGVPCGRLLGRLVDLALERQAEQRTLRREHRG